MAGSKLTAWKMLYTEEPFRGPAESIFNDPPIVSVSDLATMVRETVETEFGEVWVEGEISGFRKYGSGHCYFTLKDENAQIRCCLWRQTALRVYFEPQDGMFVQIRGYLSFYETRGELQLIVSNMRHGGEGALLKALETLKHKLAAEGLFDPEKKRPLPSYPRCIGLVTSGDGAVLHDMLGILAERFPVVQVVLARVKVQGIGAAESIVQALDTLSSLDPQNSLRPDVVILARGGGSIEDLWTFNEEPVARAIAASTIPVVSAIGHETDFTVADLVADIRAGTPSIAAGLVVPDKVEILRELEMLSSAARFSLSQKLTRLHAEIDRLTASYAFSRIDTRINEQYRTIDDLTNRLQSSVQTSVLRRRNELVTWMGQLSIHDPMRPMQNGYVRVEREGKMIRSALNLEPGDEVKLAFLDGNRTALVQK